MVKRVINQLDYRELKLLIVGGSVDGWVLESLAYLGREFENE